MKIWKIAVALIVALIFAVSLALPGLAASDVTELGVLPKILRGNVVSVDVDDSFFVVESQTQEHTIFVDVDTKYFKFYPPERLLALAKDCLKLRQSCSQEMKEQGLLPNLIPPGEHRAVWQHLRQRLQRLRQFGEKTTFSDVTVGAQVVVAVSQNRDFLAKSVFIIEPTTYERITGTIRSVSLENQTITIVSDDGEEFITLKYEENTLFTLRGVICVEAGQFARAIYNEDMVAKTVTVCPQAP